MGATLVEEQARILDSVRCCSEINLGATAIGTGITAVPRVSRVRLPPPARDHRACRWSAASNLVEATSDTGVFVQLSGVLKRTAVKVSKICNDLRLLSSGPQAGFGELRLPARQAGSSIMPGKVNPVIPEMVNQVAFSVIGNDMTVTMAAEAGQLQLNAFEPVIAHHLLQGISWMTTAFRTSGRAVHRRHRGRPRALGGVDRRGVWESSPRSLPYLGYAAAADIAKAALAGEWYGPRPGAGDRPGRPCAVGRSPASGAAGRDPPGRRARVKRPGAPRLHRPLDSLRRASPGLSTVNTLTILLP